MAMKYIFRLRRGWKDDSANRDDWADYEKTDGHIVPLQGELVLEYDNGIPRLKIGDGVSEFSALPYMSVDSFILPRPISVTLYADKWEKATDDRYYQIVDVANAVITPNSKVDLQPSSEQLCIFHDKDLAFVTENKDGVVSVYCVGQVPTKEYTIQATVTEVAADVDEVIGDTTATPNPRPDWNQTDSSKANYIENKPENLATTEYVDEKVEAIGGVQSDWNQEDATQMDYIKNKPTIPEQMTCAILHGVPTTSTEGTVGTLGMDVDSATYDVYKCVKAENGIYTWEPAIIIYKVFTRYSANAEGIDFTETWSSGQRYIGFASAVTAPTDAAAYTWSMFIAESEPTTPTALTISGVYRINDDVLGNGFSGSFDESIEFISGGVTYTQMKYDSQEGILYYINSDSNTEVWSQGSTQVDTFQEVQFVGEQEVTSTFYEIFTAGATKQVAISGRWKLNLELTHADFDQTVNFNCNVEGSGEMPYTGIYGEEYDGIFYLNFEPDDYNPVYNSDNSDSPWNYFEQLQLDFGETEQYVSPEFLAWMEANAVKSTSGDESDVTETTISGTWVFNNDLDISDTINQTVNFTCNIDGTTKTCSNIGISNLGVDEPCPEMYYNDSESAYLVYSKGWSYEDAKTVNFGTEAQVVSPEFLAWMEANAANTATRVTYKFKDDDTELLDFLAQTSLETFEVDFISNGNSYSYVVASGEQSMYYTNNSSDYNTSDDGLEVYTESGWIDEAYKTIILANEATVSERFLTYLKKMADKVE